MTNLYIHVSNSNWTTWHYAICVQSGHLRHVLKDQNLTPNGLWLCSHLSLFNLPMFSVFLDMSKMTNNVGFFGWHMALFNWWRRPSIVNGEGPSTAFLMVISDRWSFGTKSFVWSYQTLPNDQLYFVSFVQKDCDQNVHCNVSRKTRKKWSFFC